MIILCLIDSLSSGGAERQMVYLSTGLKEAGNEVKLVVFSSGNDFYYDSVKSKDVEIIEVVGKYGKCKYKRVFEIIRLVKLYKPDAVIAYKDGVTMAACIARSIYRFNLIVSERNTTQTLSKYERLKFFLYRFADKIVPNSYSQSKFIENHYPCLVKKVTVITNALDTRLFTPNTAHSYGTKREIITTARFMGQKNVITFLDAVRILKDRKVNVHFIWYGNQSVEYYKTVESKYHSLDIADYLDLMPAEKDIVTKYQQADIFCLPSLYEGFPNVVCEAMACGLPVVCSEVCDNPYIVQNGVNGFLFNPMSAEDIANKIEQMVAMTDLELTEISKRNVTRIKEMCSFPKFIERYLSILHN